MKTPTETNPYVGPRCDFCDRPADEIDHDTDTATCGSCRDNQAEAAWERYNEAMMDGSTLTFHETYLASWDEKQKAHRR